MARARDKFYDVLRKQQEEGKLVCVFHGNDGHDKFDVGFVESLSKNTLTLLAVSPRGDYDGRILLHLDDLNRIETDDRYSKKIGLIHEYRSSVFKNEDRVDAHAGSDGPAEHLRRAMESNTVVTIEDHSGHAVTGFVAELGEDYAAIEMLSPNGEPDGQAIVNLDDLNRIHIGCRDQQIRSFLYRYNFELKRLLES